MNLLIATVENAGLNRGRVMDVFREYVNKTYDGVTGTAHFDATPTALPRSDWRVRVSKAVTLFIGIRVRMRAPLRKLEGSAE
jgi:hypothetical protein